MDLAIFSKPPVFAPEILVFVTVALTLPPIHNSAGNSWESSSLLRIHHL
jgi:hypothetical protein